MTAPVLPDIKDAGALATVERWGSPYHGLIQADRIQGCEKDHAQPLSGIAWLIDRGLPPLDLAPEYVAAEAAEWREWRNYALIPGGYVYGQPLPANSYIHIDSAGVAWLVRLSYVLAESSNSVDITASLVRFGLLDVAVGVQTPVTKSVVVACEMINRAAVEPGLFDGAYNTAMANLHDVYNNGARALVCVELANIYSGGAGGSISHVYSCVEVTLGGAGGADGGGLAFAAVEIKGRGALTVLEADSGGAGLLVETHGEFGVDRIVTAVANCLPDSGHMLAETAVLVASNYEYFRPYGAAVLDGADRSFTVCRACFYDAAGVATALRVRSSRTVDGEIVTVPITLNGLTDHNYCDTGWEYAAAATWEIGWKKTSKTGVYILHDAAVIDVFERTVTQQRMQVQAAVSPGSSGAISTYYLPDAVSVTGSLVLKLNAAAIPYSDLVLLIDSPSFWFSSSMLNGDEYETVQIDTSQRVGIFRRDHTAAFYFKDSAGRIYGDVVTPDGNVSTSEAGRYNYAWQRKTGEYAFSSTPLCYV